MTKTDEWQPKVSSFKRKVNKVQAVQVRENNMNFIAGWCGGEACIKPLASSGPSVPHVLVPNIDGAKPALSGSWVLKNEQGRFTVLQNDVFVDLYEFEKPRNENHINQTELVFEQPVTPPPAHQLPRRQRNSYL